MHACKLVLKPSTSYQLLGHWHRHTEAGFAIIYCHAKPFCWLYTMPHIYMSHRDIVVLLISGPKPSGPESMEIGEKRLVNNVQTICYWTTVREYLLFNCRFIRGKRVGHWPLTLNSCCELCPWFFAFGHANYARYLPVFLKDMAKLPEVHPAVHDAFMEGMCVVQRGDKKCYCGSSQYGSSYTYHIKPQRASIFGEYTHMQLR